MKQKIEIAERKIKRIILEAIYYKKPYKRKVLQEIRKLQYSVEDTNLKKRIEDNLKSFAEAEVKRAMRVKVGDIATYGAFAAVLGATTKLQEKKAIEKAMRVAPEIKKFLQDKPLQMITPLQTYMKDYMEMVNKEVERVALKSTKGGLQLRASIEVQLRREHIEKKMEKLQEAGVDLVYISSHANCSKRCEPWQGKLYSISGKSGIIDGIRYRPLSDATDVYYTTKKGKMWKNGILSGFNCRHSPIEYKKGKKPLYWDAKTIDRVRKVEETQRAMERNITKYKDLASAFEIIDKNKAAQFRQIATRQTRAYKNFSRSNKMAYYNERIQELNA